jgi:[ribosomal protein S18]-alanine N-acetyltransferase
MAQSDLDAVAGLEQTLHVHPWTLGNFADSLEAGYQCWVAERDGALAGYCIVMNGPGEAHLLNLSVALPWQRRGIGSELAHLCIRLAREHGAEKIFLEVRPSNIAARRLYERMGFSAVATRRDYYPAGEDREDAVVMELVLS